MSTAENLNAELAPEIAAAHAKTARSPLHLAVGRVP